MKRRNAAGCFVIVTALLALFGFHNVVRAGAEVINNFNADITIQANGSVFVTENITYNFGSNQKHGIFRDIPLTAANSPQLVIDVSGVSNEVGQPYQYTTSTTNNVLRIKIGDPNALITGIKTYIIRYQVYNAIRTLSDHDELYWNVTGNQWPLAIENATASVVLPDSATVNARMDCFTGPQGSTQKNCTFSQDGLNVHYATTQPLNVNEGLTFVLGIPLGYIQNTYVPSRQTYPTSRTSIFKSNFLFGIFLSLFFIIFVFVLVILFARRVRTAKPKPVIPNELRGQPVVVAYSPPDDLPPIEIGTLLDRRVDITDIASVIMDLAVRGYIKIRYTLQEIRFWPDRKDFKFIKLKDGADLVHPADKIIFNFLFGAGNRINLSDLSKRKINFHSEIKRVKKDTEKYLVNKGYFAENKARKLKTFLLFAAIILFVLIAGRTFLHSPWFRLDFFIFFAVVIAVFSIKIIKSARAVHRLTPKGLSAFGKILGFKEFLEVTDKDKLRLLNAPDLRPEIFEKFLPYAMVLGVEDKWAQKFESIYNTIPKWYEDPTATSFNSYVLARNLTLFNASFNHAFNITSSQSSGGFGSGFGGGGSSGGGSGGGGGGGW